MVWKYVKAIVNRLYGYYVTRTIQGFNVENRTERLLDSQVKRVAPRHPHTQEKFEQLTKDNLNIKKEIEEKREDLLSRLRSINIKSNEKIDEKTDKSKLPKQRLPPEVTMFGIKEPSHIPEGRLSLRQIIQILSNSKNPVEFSVEKVAKEYRVDEEKIRSLLSYFQIFKVFDPEKVRQPQEWIEVLTSSVGKKRPLFIQERPKPKEDIVLKKPGEK